MRSLFASCVIVVLSSLAVSAQQSFPGMRFAEPVSTVEADQRLLPVSGQNPFRLPGLSTTGIRVRPAVTKQSAGPRPEPRFFSSDFAWVVRELDLDSRGAPISANTLKIPREAQKELDKGLTSANKRDYAQARRHFNAALDAYPDFSDAFHNLGVLALLQQDHSSAEGLFLQALETDERNIYSLFALAQLKLSRDLADEASPFAERFLTVSPSNVFGLELMATVQLQQGKIDAAIQTCARIDSMRDKHRPEIHLLAGSAYELKNAQARAVEEYKKYLKEAPKEGDKSEVASAIAELQRLSAAK